VTSETSANVVTLDAAKSERVIAKAKAIADLGPVERPWQVSKQAEALSVDRGLLEKMVTELLKDREKKQKAEQAEARRQDQRAERSQKDAERKDERKRERDQKQIEKDAERKQKDKSKALADIAKLPAAQHEAKLAELAKRIGEDISALRDEFVELCAATTEGSAAPSTDWDIEPWGEPVTTVMVLEELIARINRHIKATPEQILCIALWIMMAWAHEIAAHYSLYLVATSPDIGMGKTTLLVDVLARLVPKPYVCGANPTEASIFRAADRDKPTMLFDNVDTLFRRKPEVTELFLNGWTRGIGVPRSEKIGGTWMTVRYDPFCPKACSLTGTNMPPALLGRCLLIELWPLKPGETVDKVNPHDEALKAEFVVLSRKLLRWSQDNSDALKLAMPLFPAGFVSRPADNARLLLAIAELAGDGWAGKARSAVDRLLREQQEPGWLKLLVGELWDVFIEKGDENIASKQLLTRLTEDPTSVWNEYSRDRPVTERQVAALIRKVHIRPRLIGKKRVSGYYRQDFLDRQVFEHFLGRDPLILSPKATKKGGRRKVRG
jgi:putative DNA primase/helicase